MWVETVEHDVTITGEAPCYEGWTFIAALDWDPNAGLIVRTAPGVETVEREGLVEGWCDHCKKARKRRKTMLVLNTETGQQIQIGSTCIKDFLGWSGMPVFKYEDEIREEIEESWGGFGGSAYVDYATETALATAWAAIKVFGFVSAKSWDGQSTRDAVRSVLSGRSKADKELRARLAEVIDGCYDRAREVRAYILSDDFAGASEYVRNLKAIAGAEYVSPRNLGMLVSAPQAHARHLEQTLVRARKAEVGADSEWVGKVVTGKNAKGKNLPKERRVITGTLVGIKYMGLTQVSYYNAVERVLYTVLTDEGNIVKLWNSYPEGSTGIFGEDEGVRVTFKASIEAHDEYKGRKETTVKRPADVEVTPAEVAK
jgi:hypothetical protein